MASSSSLLTEEQLLCPICLAVFVQPVSTPCGHNYCMSCLTSYWDSSAKCICPVCKESFSNRPDLKVNTFISGLSQTFMSLQLCEEQAHTRVLCEMCTTPQRDAVKSCVECRSSYCEAHLEPHHRVSGLRRHTLVEPVSSLEDRVCSQHQQLLHLFCTNDGQLLCPACEGSHSNHKTLPLQQAHRELRAELGGTEARVTSMIQERVQRVCSIRQSVTQRQDQTRQLAKSVQDLAALVKKMEQKQQEVDSEAVAVSAQIEQELSDLRGTQTKLKELKLTKDPHVFLQNYPHRMLRSEPTAVTLHSELELNQLRRSLSSSLSQLQLFADKMSTLSDTNGTALRHVQQFAVDFTLDPKTAHHKLILSHDLKQVRYNTDSNVRPNPGSNPARFTKHLAVLGRRSISSGRFYFEVFVDHKTEWIVGVATASIQRKGKIPHAPGCGVWALCFRMDYFEPFIAPNVTVHQGKMERVGVFVDYAGGQVSFYDVNAAKLIYSFDDCAFTEKLYPYFNPCNNEFESNLGPLVLVPVNQN